MQDSTAASSRDRPCSCSMFGKFDDQKLFETTMPVIMMTPISDMMLSVLPRQNRIITTPASPGGMAIRMMKDRQTSGTEP